MINSESEFQIIILYKLKFRRSHKGFTYERFQEVFNPQDFLMRQVKNELGVNTNEEAEFALKQEAEDEQEEMEEEDSNSQGGTEKSEDTTLFANSGDDAPLSLMIVKKEVKTEPV